MAAPFMLVIRPEWGQLPRFLRLQRYVAEEALDEEQTEDSQKGGEPEGRKTDYERECSCYPCGEVGHGDELAVEAGLYGPDAAGEHAQDAEERADGEGGDDAEGGAG